MRELEENAVEKVMIKDVMYSFFFFSDLNNCWGINQDPRELQKLTHLQNWVPIKRSVLQEECQD